LQPGDEPLENHMYTSIGRLTPEPTVSRSPTSDPPSA
jgi:hypothetical protein